MRRVVLLAPAAALIALVAFACDDVFVPGSVVTKLRILAVRAEPPEAGPGQTVRLDALVVDPEPGAAPLALRWLACDPAPLSPCDDSAAIRDRDRLPTLTGVRDLGTATVATYTFPGALAEGEERSAVVLLIARSGGIESIARKEIVLSRSTEPNQNPELEYILFGSRRVGEGDAARALPGDVTTWSAIATSSSTERYLRPNPDGTRATAFEDLRFSWYSTHGRFGTEYTPPSARPIIDRFVDSGPKPPDVGPREGGGESSSDELGMKVTLNLPEPGTEPPVPSDGRIRVFVVLRDARGGTTWAERSVQLR